MRTFEIGRPCGRRRNWADRCALFHDEYPAKKIVHEYALKIDPKTPLETGTFGSPGLGKSHPGGGCHEKADQAGTEWSWN